MKNVWVVHYQIPIDNKRSGSVVSSSYRSESVAFHDKMDAVKFFRNEIEPQKWFDKSVCWIEGPVELR